MRPMKIELDAASTLEYLDLWKKAVDMEIPLAPFLRSHLMIQRDVILDRYKTTGDTLTGIYRQMKALDSESEIQLERTRHEIKMWCEWVATSQAQMNEFRKQ